MSAVASRRCAAVRLVTLLLAVGLAVAGCGGGTAVRADVLTSTGEPAATTGPDAFEASGRGLLAPVTVAPAGTPEPYPLVVALHSLFHDSSEPRTQWGLDELAAANGFAVAYPDGIGMSWNAGTCCDAASAHNVDDVGWLRSLIAHLASQYPIDRQRIYLVGYSNGGMLAYRYACEHGDEIAGIGVVAGSLEVADCRPPAPVTVVSVHGLADMHVPYAGIDWSQVLQTRISSGPESLAPFRTAAGCPDPDQPGDAVFTDADGKPPGSSIPTGNSGDAAASRDVGGSVRPDSGPGPAPELLAPPVADAPPPLAIRFESACSTGATVVEYQLPGLSHGWPPLAGPGAFDTVGAIWNILAPARSATAVPLF